MVENSLKKTKGSKNVGLLLFGCAVRSKPLFSCAPACIKRVHLGVRKRTEMHGVGLVSLCVSEFTTPLQKAVACMQGAKSGERAPSFPTCLYLMLAAFVLGPLQ